MVNKVRKRIVLELGEWVECIFAKIDSSLIGRKKLIISGDGPFHVLEILNDNAYKIDLPLEYQFHNTFNVCDLSPFSTPDNDDPSNLRTNFLRRRK